MESTADNENISAQFEAATDKIYHFLSLGREKIEGDSKLIEEVFDILNFVGEQLKNKKWLDALEMLNQVAEYYYSPDTMIIASNILANNSHEIEKHIWVYSAKINYECFKAALDLVYYGNASEKEIGAKILQDHIKEILDCMHAGYGQDFGIFIETAVFADSKQPNKDVEENIRKYVFANQNNYSVIAYCLRYFYKGIYDIGEEAIGLQIAKYGLPVEKTIKAWIASTADNDDALAFVLYNTINTIECIEKERPGIAKFLNEKFGIFDFYRYPQDILISQYDEYENTELPYGVILYPRADQAGKNSGVFYSNQGVMSSLHWQLRGKFAIRVGEGESKLDIVRLLHKMQKQYGSKHKISFAIIGGHGTKDSIQFGNGDDIKHHLYIKDLEDPRADRKGYFEPNPTIILNSCSTGFENGIGQALSDLFGATVIAPTEPASIQNIFAHPENSGTIQFKVEYGRENVEAVYSAGKPK